MTSPRNSPRTRIVVLALALLLLAAAIAGLVWYQRLRQHLRSAEASLAQVEGALTGGPQELLHLLQDPAQMAAMQKNLARLDLELDRIASLARPALPLAPHLGWLPRIGGDVAAAPHLLAMAQEISSAALALTEGLSPLAARLSQTEAGLARLGPDLVTALEQARPQLEAAQGALERAVQARGEVDPLALSSQTRGLVERFDRLLPLAEGGVNALLALPTLLGADGARTYLLLAQNNQELRATGGFVSGVGTLQIENGAISRVRFMDSYAVDDLSQPHPAPPEPLRQHMGAGLLLLRDANWWPDFPTSAEVIAGLYRHDQGVAADGVIAVDLEALRLLLQAAGPVEVPGYDQLVTGDNLQQMIMAYWEAPRISAPGKEGADWWLHRKDFAADLLAALMERLMDHATPQGLLNLARAAGQALQQRHLLVYVKSGPGQALFSKLGWDGAQRPFADDYLMIVDSNVGFNKANPNVEQTADYQVHLDEAGQATAQLTLTYRHRIQRPAPACIHEARYGDSYADLLERCYWDYLRVYVPLGSEVLEVLGADEPAQVYDENGRTVIAVSFLLETGQARQIQILYRPNRAAVAGSYRLLVQKQPGTAAMPLRITIEPPEGAQPASASPAGVVWLDGRAVWQGDLATDREIELAWR